MSEELEKEDHDERTLKLLKKYFSFFKIHGYLPKKWKRNIIRHLDTFFSNRDEIIAEMEAKDDILDKLSFDEIVSIINQMADAWEDATSKISDILDQVTTSRENLQESFQSLYDMIETVLKDQDNGDWYNPVDFGVYCGIDHSLTFYYGKAPSVGDTYSGKTVTAVYTNFSDKIYTSKSGVPWNEYRSLVEFVAFNSSYALVMPENVSYWFADMTACDYLDLSYLDSRNVTSADSFATGCTGLSFIKLGGNTDLFTRFDKIVSQEYWYTTSALVPGTYLHETTNAGTYYTSTPYYSGTITAYVPAGFTDSISVDLGDAHYTLSYSTYTASYNLPMYDGATLLNYEITVSYPDGYSGDISGNINDGFTIDLGQTFIEVPISVSWDSAITSVPESITVTLRNLTTGVYYDGLIYAADGWTGVITVPEGGTYDCISENFDNEIWDIQGNIYDGFTIVYTIINQTERIDYTIVFFSADETKSYSDGALTVETNPEFTSYSDGVLTLPDYLDE